MKDTTGGGISLCTLLTVAFVTLKLCKVIDWSWWWVLAPLWWPWAIAAAVGAVMMTVIVAVKVLMRLLKGGDK